jgi:hypothetical protein
MSVAKAALFFACLPACLLTVLLLIVLLLLAV